jgi:hypothetical protein
VYYKFLVGIERELKIMETEHTGVENVDSNFVSLGRGNLDVFDFQVLASSPTYGSFALYDSPSGIVIRHFARVMGVHFQICLIRFSQRNAQLVGSCPSPTYTTREFVIYPRSGLRLLTP